MEKAGRRLALIFSVPPELQVQYVCSLGQLGFPSEWPWIWQENTKGSYFFQIFHKEKRFPDRRQNEKASLGEKDKLSKKKS